ncbi:MAG: hypothetical protein AAFN81_02860 [Bacteroidota bacterium]
MENQFYRHLHLVFASLSAFAFGFWLYHFGTGWPRWVNALLGVLGGLLAYGLFMVLWPLLGKTWQWVPERFRLAILAIGGSLVTVKMLGLSWPDYLYYPVAIVTALLFTLLLWGVSGRGNKLGRVLAVLLPLIALAWGLNWALAEGNDPFPDSEQYPSPEAQTALFLEDGVTKPNKRGRYMVKHFTYGSGDDQQREEYAANILYQTPTVNARRLLPEWKGKKKKWRERYWGFGVETFPLNGRVYLPVGEGPFPLVLIVHGNHSMLDYSDGGYAYLGELLASRGMVVVSVDENFINGHWSGDFMGKEMPTRAWLLLKHLEQWEQWTNDASHALYGKANMEQIMLMGHSRGGEAVSIAAAFNQLPHFPDDAREKFDFGFAIRGVVSIAPTDYRYHRQMDLEDVNYLSIQGSYDADETSFWGLRPYHRLQFSDSTNYFKAGVYIHRANHGQFNSSWGRSDFGGTFASLLNTEPIMPGEDQRQAAQVLISAFAEAVFNNDLTYRSLFMTPQSAQGIWLPKGYYLGHYSSSRHQTIQDFEEDIDLSTGKAGVQIAANQLAVWREETLTSRDGGSIENNVLVAGWDYGKEVKPDSLATYTISLPSFINGAADTVTHLVLDVGHGHWADLPDQSEEDSTDDRRLDFRIEVQDQTGQIASVLLSESGHSPQPILRTRFTKLQRLDEERFDQEHEPQLETFALPTHLFQTQSAGAVNWQQLTQIRLIFDQSPAGVALVDDIRLAVGF